MIFLFWEIMMLKITNTKFGMIERDNFTKTVEIKLINWRNVFIYAAIFGLVGIYFINWFLI